MYSSGYESYNLTSLNRHRGTGYEHRSNQNFAHLLNQYNNNNESRIHPITTTSAPYTRHRVQPQFHVLTMNEISNNCRRCMWTFRYPIVLLFVSIIMTIVGSRLCEGTSGPCSRSVASMRSAGICGVTFIPLLSFTAFIYLKRQEQKARAAEASSQQPEELPQPRLSPPSNLPYSQPPRWYNSYEEANNSTPHRQGHSSPANLYEESNESDDSSEDDYFHRRSSSNRSAQEPRRPKRGRDRRDHSRHSSSESQSSLPRMPVSERNRSQRQIQPARDQLSSMASSVSSQQQRISAPLVVTNVTVVSDQSDSFISSSQQSNIPIAMVVAEVVQDY